MNVCPTLCWYHSRGLEWCNLSRRGIPTEIPEEYVHQSLLDMLGMIFVSINCGCGNHTGPFGAFIFVTKLANRLEDGVTGITHVQHLVVPALKDNSECKQRAIEICEAKWQECRANVVGRQPIVILPKEPEHVNN